MADGSVHFGHRARKRTKFLSHGADVFDSYELLEMLLYFVIPYRDTNPIAHKLFEAFGTLDGVLSADVSALAAVDGVGERTASFLSEVGEAGLSALFYRGTPKERFDTYDKMIAFFLDRFRGLQTPALDVLYLDNRLDAIAAERLYETDFSSGSVHPASAVREALRLHAPVAVLCHNHPHGAAFPTESDRAGHKAFFDDLSLAGVTLIDHFLIAGERILSIHNPRAYEFKTQDVFGAYYETCPTDASNLTDAPPPALFEGGVSFLTRLLSFTADGDAEATARKLLSVFFSPERVFTADMQELSACDGIDARTAFFLPLLLAVTRRRFTETFVPGIHPSTAEVKTFLTAYYATKRDEEVLLLAFDKEDCLLGVSTLSRGTVNSSDVDRRLTLERALALRAEHVVLAHNHPFGETEPSHEDIRTTNQLFSALRTVGIRLADHYIIAGFSAVSVMKDGVIAAEAPTIP